MRAGVVAACAALVVLAVVPSGASAYRLPERDPVGAQLARVEPAVCTADQHALWDFASGSSSSFVGHVTGHATCPARGSVVRVWCTLSLVDPTGNVVATSSEGTGYVAGYDQPPATCEPGQLDVGPFAGDQRGYSARFLVGIDVRGEGADAPTTFCVLAPSSCRNDLPLQPGVGTAAGFE
jgi:hypothetical protein